MRRAAKIDRNQRAIIDALRAIGCSVQSLAAIGKGCPDILVGVQGRNLLMEIKDGDLCPSEQALTTDQQCWHSTWRGQVALVTSTTEAVHSVNVMGARPYSKNTEQMAREASNKAVLLMLDELAGNLAVLYNHLPDPVREVARDVGVMLSDLKGRLERA